MIKKPMRAILPFSRSCAFIPKLFPAKNKKNKNETTCSLKTKQQTIQEGRNYVYPVKHALDKVCG